MKLTFLGANHEVTGSCTFWKRRDSASSSTAGWSRARMSTRTSHPVAPGEIDGVLATHAHIDHTACCPCWCATASGQNLRY